MARPLRPEVDHGFWHAWNGGNEARPIVRSDRDRQQFCELLAETVRRFHWNLLTWVLVTDQFHLVIETSTPNLTSGMHWLETSYAIWFNRQHHRVGHLFRGRFKSALVEEGEYLREWIREITLQPVRAGLVDRPAKHRWSGYRALAGLESTPLWLDDRWLRGFETDLDPNAAPNPGHCRERYRQFIDAGIGSAERLRDRLVGQIYFGSRTWVESMQAVVDGKPRSDEHSAIQRCAGKPEMAQVIEAVAGAAETTYLVIRHSRGGALRMLSAWLGWYEGMRGLRQIAAALRLRSTGYISDLIRRCDHELRHNVGLQHIADGALTVLRPPPLRPTL